MKEYVKYHAFDIPRKYRVDIRITIDDRGAEYVSNYNGNTTTSISFPSLITVNIIRPSEIDENGNRVRTPWNPNDSLALTKFTFPIFKNNIKKIREDLKTPDLYTYVGKRLELNEALAEKIRNPFPVGNTIVELSAVVITQADETRVEGVKIKFNNEQSSVLLTLNELDSLISNFDDMNVDVLTLLLYLNYMKHPCPPKTFEKSSLKTDIIPKDEF